MEWSETGIVLDTQKFGEGSAVISLLTRNHGRHRGLVRGINRKSRLGVYQTGNLVSAVWRARLEDHLGTFLCELTESKASLYLDDPIRLAGLLSACSVIEMVLPEREGYPQVYESLYYFLSNLNSNTWLEEYIKLELMLLSELGFGLDLSTCISTGKTEQLIYVSPKSGCAVNADAGEPYKDNLLSLPDFLGKKNYASSESDLESIYAGLILTGYFMNRYIFVHNKNGEPQARTRLVDRIKQNNII